jgi:hypothetical protein
MNLDNVTRDDWIVGGLALLLGIFLLVLPWFDISFGIGGVAVVSGTLTATDSPDGWTAVLGMLAAFAVVADLAVERLSPQTQIPAIGGGREQTRFVLASIAVGFVALKFLLHIHFSGILSFGWGFYVIVIVSVALLYVTQQARHGRPVMPSRPTAPRRPPAAPTGRRS